MILNTGTPPVLSVSDLVKRYRTGTVANDGISFSLHPGEIYGLLGPNGAGKTTLVRQVLGVLRPTAGTITLAGRDVVADPGFARKNVGFLPQGQFDLLTLRVGELIEFSARLRGMDPRSARVRRDELIGQLDLGQFASTSMHAASGGVRRLAGFAAAIAAPARLLVLDEPTNDVDPIRRQLLWNSMGELGEQGATVLLVTHNLAEAERFIDRLAIIDGGKIVREGTPGSLRSLVTDKLRLETAFRGDVSLHPALIAESMAPGRYLFEQRDLSAVSAWLSAAREAGLLADFRIGPPTLDDIYAAVVAPPRELEAAS
ncbi:MAG: ABC transporter ATP-binding protein [Dehalococcoidia bacterium]|uniref:ABC transporter ATP-binding protein n=1 Tax=Candidatus Amarobacter glycogenicus TaxID=3140699 RepID=UPI0031352F33|nr:ABC transporter ATP-binding protein [Dehalococcoidia bacterium]